MVAISREDSIKVLHRCKNLLRKIVAIPHVGEHFFCSVRFLNHSCHKYSVVGNKILKGCCPEELSNWLLYFNWAACNRHLLLAKVLVLQWSKKIFKTVLLMTILDCYYFHWVVIWCSQLVAGRYLAGWTISWLHVRDALSKMAIPQWSPVSRHIFIAFSWSNLLMHAGELSLLLTCNRGSWTETFNSTFSPFPSSRGVRVSTANIRGSPGLDECGFKGTNSASNWASELYREQNKSLDLPQFDA